MREVGKVMIGKARPGQGVRTGSRSEPQRIVFDRGGQKIKEAGLMNDDKVTVDSFTGDGMKKSQIIGVRGGSAYNHTLNAENWKKEE